MEFYRDYGLATTIRVPVPKALTDDFALSGDWTPATGDVKIIKDAGSIANVGTLPTLHSNSAFWTYTFSATEMEASIIEVQTCDDFGNSPRTQAVKDNAFVIRTYPPGVIHQMKASAGAATTVTVPSSGTPSIGAVITTADILNGCRLDIVAGTGRGQSRVIRDMSNAGVLTVDTWATNPDSTSVIRIWGFGAVPVSNTTVTDLEAGAANLSLIDDIKGVTDRLDTTMVSDGNSPATYHFTAASLAEVLSDIASSDAKLDIIDGIVDLIVAVTAKLDTMVQSDGNSPAAYIYKTAALANAPAGGGGSGNSPDAIAAAVFSHSMGSGMSNYTFTQVVNIIAAVIAGRSSGMDTNDPVFRNLANTADVVTATTDSDGNRTAMTHNP